MSFLPLRLAWPSIPRSPTLFSDSTHRSNNLDSVDPAHTALQSLPSRYPASCGIRERDQSLKDLRCAFLNRVGGIGEAEEGLAVRAAVT